MSATAITIKLAVSQRPLNAFWPASSLLYDAVFCMMSEAAASWITEIETAPNQLSHAETSTFNLS
jgi:hypothetical protein